MTVWVVRAGKYGESEEAALAQDTVVIGWPALGDLTPVKTRDELERRMAEAYPNELPKTRANYTGQVWAFSNVMKDGDLVLLPLKHRAAIAVGQVTGGYRYRPEFPGQGAHARSVTWINKELPRVSLGEGHADILQSLSGQGTVFRVVRPSVEERVLALAQGRSTPGPAIPSPGEEPPTWGDLEAIANDQVVEQIGRRFRADGLTALVAALLRAEGYAVQQSPAGVDGGIDIIAGRGTMGFDPPRLCVQVKSWDKPVDVKVLRELQGVMKTFGANQGLLVSWGGFLDTVLKEARLRFFDIRLWDAGDVVASITENYERLPADLRAIAPLKRVWVWADSA